MKFFLFVVSLVAAVILEWSIANSFKFIIVPPLMALIAFFWFWNIKFQHRIYLALALGFFMDSISLFPFGTYMGTFIIIVLLSEFLQLFLSNTYSFLVEWIGVGVLIFSLFFVIPLVSYLFGTIESQVTVFTYQEMLTIFSYGFFWAFILPFLIISGQYGWRILRTK